MKAEGMLGHFYGLVLWRRRPRFEEIADKMV